MKKYIFPGNIKNIIHYNLNTQFDLAQGHCKVMFKKPRFNLLISGAFLEHNFTGIVKTDQTPHTGASDLNNWWKYARPILEQKYSLTLQEAIDDSNLIYTAEYYLYYADGTKSALKQMQMPDTIRQYKTNLCVFIDYAESVIAAAENVVIEAQG